MQVKFWIRHDVPMAKACLSFQIINQFQQAAVYAWAFPNDVKFGIKKGKSVLICHFSSLRLNVGQFYLRVNLAEPPGGEHYQRLDGICPFEIVQVTEAKLWGSNPNDCVYHEQWRWSVGCE